MPSTMSRPEVSRRNRAGHRNRPHRPTAPHRTGLVPDRTRPPLRHDPTSHRPPGNQPHPPLHANTATHGNRPGPAPPHHPRPRNLTRDDEFPNGIGLSRRAGLLEPCCPPAPPWRKAGPASEPGVSLFQPGCLGTRLSQNDLGHPVHVPGAHRRHSERLVQTCPKCSRPHPHHTWKAPTPRPQVQRQAGRIEAHFPRHSRSDVIRFS